MMKTKLNAIMLLLCSFEIPTLNTPLKCFCGTPGDSPVNVATKTAFQLVNE